MDCNEKKNHTLFYQIIQQIGEVNRMSMGDKCWVLQTIMHQVRKYFTFKRKNNVSGGSNGELRDFVLSALWGNRIRV